MDLRFQSTPLSPVPDVESRLRRTTDLHLAPLGHVEEVRPNFYVTDREFVLIGLCTPLSLSSSIRRFVYDLCLDVSTVYDLPLWSRPLYRRSSAVSLSLCGGVGGWGIPGSDWCVVS